MPLKKRATFLILIICSLSARARNLDAFSSVPLVSDDASLFLSGIEYSDDTLFTRMVFARTSAFAVDCSSQTVPIGSIDMPLLEAGVRFGIDRLRFSASCLTGSIPRISAEIDSSISPQSISLLPTPFGGGRVSAEYGDVSVMLGGGYGSGRFNIEGTDFGEYSMSALFASVSWRKTGAYVAALRGDLSAKTWYSLTASNSFSFSSSGKAAIDAYGAWTTVGIDRGKCSADVLVSCSLLINDTARLSGKSVSILGGTATSDTIACELTGRRALFAICRPSFEYAFLPSMAVSVDRVIPFLYGWKVVFGTPGHSGTDAPAKEYGGEFDTSNIDMVTLLLSGMGLRLSLLL